MTVNLKQRQAASRIISELRWEIGALECEIGSIQRQTLEGRFDRSAQRRVSSFLARLHRNADGLAGAP